VGDLDAPRLDPADHHHLARVLRLHPGAELTAGDGAGRWRPCRLSGSEALEAMGEVVSEPQPAPSITVAFALAKGERPELAVQKLTELGVDRIVPFVAGRSVVRWDDAKAARQLERWRTITRHAAMQCRRTWLPAVERVSSFSSVAVRPGAALADRTGRSPTLDHPVVLAGPEGGWTPEERASGLPCVRLGEHVLRSDTAAITIGVVLTAMRAGIIAQGVGGV
jgi:16S rRNA (uracil1498-N3)-methyltransferase